MMQPIDRAISAIDSCKTVDQVKTATRYAILAVDRTLAAPIRPAAMRLLDELVDRQRRRIRKKGFARA